MEQQYKVFTKYEVAEVDKYGAVKNVIHTFNSEYEKQTAYDLAMRLNNAFTSGKDSGIKLGEDAEREKLKAATIFEVPSN